MTRSLTITCRLASYLLAVALLLLLESATADDAFTDIIRPALRRHCFKCHGGESGKAKGEINLVERPRAVDFTRDPELLKSLIEVLDSETMPPEDEPTLSPKKREQLVTQLQQLLHAAVSSQKTFAQTSIRRMNRFQYNNAVEDLFELTVEVFALPERMLREHGNYFQPATGKMPDDLKAGSRPLGKSQLIDKRLEGVAPFPQDLRAEHGFDNRADHLSLSPLLLESFLKLSRSIVESEDFNEKTCGIWEAFFTPPSESENTEVVIRDRLRRFLTRAFRQPIDDESLDRYAGHVIARIESGESFTDGMKAASSATLASPRFLYLYDRVGSADDIDLLDDFELASRLSFFLWGSIPDQTLLDLAAEGKLHDRTVLGVQVDRMLNDRRLKRFCDSFPTQWLQLERIVSSVPDPTRYPDFYFAKFRTSMHMMLEPLLLFETILIEDRSILELIDSDFSYRSELLESWYRDGTGIEKIVPTAIPFRRVGVTDRRQGGVITNAAVMTMTSGAVRTQPITRGAWIAGVIFNDPPEPPPADVPPLSEDDAEETKELTLRERFAAHRNRVDCAGCHGDRSGAASAGRRGVHRCRLDAGLPGNGHRDGQVDRVGAPRRPTPPHRRGRPRTGRLHGRYVAHGGGGACRVDPRPRPVRDHRRGHQPLYSGLPRGAHRRAGPGPRPSEAARGDRGRRASVLAGARRSCGRRADPPQRPQTHGPRHRVSRVGRPPHQ